jgi:hypothetical protein
MVFLLYAMRNLLHRPVYGVNSYYCNGDTEFHGVTLTRTLS